MTLKKENIFAVALVDKMSDNVEYVQAYPVCCIAQLDGITELMKRKDSKDTLYRVYVLDVDMYCMHSYALYDNEIVSLPGGFLDELLSNKIVDFMFDKVFREVTKNFINECN